MHRWSHPGFVPAFVVLSIPAAFPGSSGELDLITANNTATIDTAIALIDTGFESGGFTAWD